MFKLFFLVMSTTSTLAGCQIGSGATNMPTPSPSPNPTTAPTNILTPPIETTAPSPEPTPVPTLGPILPPTGTSFSGVVLNETGKPLVRAIITARSLLPNFPYEDLTETNNNGEYFFRNAPLSNNNYSIEILLTASKPGYASEEYRILLKSEQKNQFDFLLPKLF